MARGVGDRLARFALVVFVGAAVVQVLCALTAARVYLQDLPEWVYQGALTERYAAGDPGVVAHYRLVSYPVPNSLFQVVDALLAGPFGWHIATKLFVSLYVASFTALLAVEMRRRWPDEWAERALVGQQVVCFAATYWLGNLNFQTGLLLVLAYVALAERKRLPWWAVALAGVVVFFAHAVAYAFFAGYVLLAAWRTREPARAYALAPSALLGGWYVVGRALDPIGFGRAEMGLVSESADTSLAHRVLAKVQHLVRAGPFENLRVAGGDSFLSDPLYLAMILVGAACVVALVAGAAVRWRSHPKATRITTFGLLALALVIPPNLFGVYMADSRIITITLGIIVLACSLPAVARRTGVVVCTATAIYQAVFAYHQVRFHPGLDRTDDAELSTAGHGWRENLARQTYLTVQPYMHASSYEALGNGALKPVIFDTAMIVNRVDH